MKVWVTKHALTDGVFEDDIDFVYASQSGISHFPTRELAIQKAESMRLKKIASLKKQIAKLEKLSFQ